MRLFLFPLSTHFWQLLVPGIVLLPHPHSPADLKEARLFTAEAKQETHFFLPATGRFPHWQKPEFRLIELLRFISSTHTEHLVCPVFTGLRSLHKHSPEALTLNRKVFEDAAQTIQVFFPFSTGVLLCLEQKLCILNEMSYAGTYYF